MALSRDKISAIPDDAVILTKSEAIKYQMKILTNWKDSSDIWAFRHGPTILSSLSALTGIYLNSYYRKKLKLHSLGRLSSYLPICVLPAVTTFIMHTEFVLPRVVLQNDCVVCTEISSCSIQAFSGCVLPAILAPLSTFSLASRYLTCDNLPFITREPLKVFQYYRNVTKPIGSTMFGFFIGHAVAASIVTYLELRSVDKCNEKLMQMEYEVEKMMK